MMKQFPVRLERHVPAESSEDVYRAVAELLQREGYQVQDAEPGSRESTGLPRGFRAIQDTVLDARQRRHGYVMLALAAALTVLMLVVYVTELTTNRFVASAPLLPIVLLGGWGLSRLREPAQTVRRIVETRFEPSQREPGALSVVLQAGMGHAEGRDSVSGWVEEEQEASVIPRRLDEVLAKFKAA